MNPVQAEILENTGHLVGKCRKGDMSSFKVLYHLFSKPVYNAVFRLLTNREDAEDVLQDAFITAFASLDKLQNDELFGAWIRTIAVNKSLDLLRKRDRRIVSIEHTEEPVAEELQEEETEYDVREITEAHSMLPLGYRVITGLFLFEQLSHRDIAQRLGISEGTSKSQYARGRKKLIELIHLNRMKNA